MSIIYRNEKISTDISGLDRLLFGGVQLQSFENKKKPIKPLKIVIKGESGTSRALFAMQLLHGLTKSLYELRSPNENNSNEVSLTEPIFFSNAKEKENLDDMHLDTLISKCVYRIIEDNIKDNSKWTECKFCSTIFDIKENCLLSPLNCAKLDQYLSEEAVNYNNRTNSLHVAIPYHPNELNYHSDNNIIIAPRKHDTILDYINNENINEMGELSKEFFNIHISTGEEDEILNRIRNLKPLEYCPCMVIDSPNDKSMDYTKYYAPKTLIIIYVVNNDTTTPIPYPDLLIEMRCHEDKETEYITNQLCIHKSILQTTALGWHQYKKRDYGIEVYPSAHVLLQRRRHMPKALLRGYTDVLTETYQQFIDNYDSRKKEKNHESLYEAYSINKKSESWQRLRKNYFTLQEDLSVCTVLKKILTGHSPEEEEEEKEPGGKVTAIIGESNTYKRYLSLGSTFSASCRQKHTLNVLLDQEYYTLRKRMVCPSWAFKSFSTQLVCNAKQNSADCTSCKKCKLPNCHNCYPYIHFWDLRMGYITSDEFFYYFIRQICIHSQNYTKLNRVVIDDIQKIDYSFPLLKRDKLFLTTLIAICKDYEIDLFILCDKNASFAKELRSLADNVICTERVNKENRFYVERYAGYNAPSHIFGCNIKKIEELFFCEIRGENKVFSLNGNRIEPIYVPNMDHFWVSSDTNKIINNLHNKK